MERALQSLISHRQPISERSVSRFRSLTYRISPFDSETPRYYLRIVFSSSTELLFARVLTRGRYHSFVRKKAIEQPVCRNCTPILSGKLNGGRLQEHLESAHHRRMFIYISEICANNRDIFSATDAPKRVGYSPARRLTF